MKRPAPADPSLGPPDWSRRYKENLARLHSGDPDQIAGVVRQLSARELATGISAGERRMLAKARQILDHPDEGTTGTREPRRPLPPGGTISNTLTEPGQIRNRTLGSNPPGT